jgi:hypothetical protein
VTAGFATWHLGAAGFFRSFVSISGRAGSATRGGGGEGCVASICRGEQPSSSPAASASTAKDETGTLDMRSAKRTETETCGWHLAQRRRFHAKGRWAESFNRTGEWSVKIGYHLLSNINGTTADGASGAKRCDAGMMAL